VANAAIGAGNQDCLLCDVHFDLLVGPTLAGFGWPFSCLSTG